MERPTLTRPWEDSSLCDPDEIEYECEPRLPTLTQPWEESSLCDPDEIESVCEPRSPKRPRLDSEDQAPLVSEEPRLHRMLTRAQAQRLRDKGNSPDDQEAVEMLIELPELTRENDALGEMDPEPWLAPPRQHSMTTRSMSRADLLVLNRRAVQGLGWEEC